MAERWSPDHLRLHRLLRRRPELLPAGQPLLLAVSGGQDSMALLALLQDLRRLHHWPLELWHGDHGWRPESARQAAELCAWAGRQGLTIHCERWEAPQRNEAAARQWRYGRLLAWGQTLGSQRVVTGHTGSDRAETLLLQLARGSHRQGASGPRPLRPLASDPVASVQLARPLLAFSREDTGRICRELALPLWLDASNSEPVHGRNRIRLEVLPVLEALHPGASGRLSAWSERLAEEADGIAELTQLALRALEHPDPPPAGSLDRPALLGLAPANARLLLQAWLERNGVPKLAARQLDTLLERLAPGRPPGCHPLAGGLDLHWQRQRLWLATRGQLP
ncbi:MAG: tRNA lysidine(34) synthetase TilS [Vulcanococcus sp.]|jgi:tRNA(Ile)-lysidine synthase